MDPYIERMDNIMADDSFENVTVADVYDQASGIGKEFEKLIDNYGVDAVTDLMPKVIKALEQLELLAGRYEKENTEINELRLSIDKLETEKAEKAQERLRYEEELIQIEENWQKESKDLLRAVSRLQEENRRLRDNLVDTQQAVQDEVAAVAKQTEEKEIEVLTKLKETVDKQREELRKHKREAQQKNLDCEALQAQLEQVVKMNTDLRRNNSIHRKQSHTLLEEKSNLEAKLVDKEQQITKITDLLKEQESLEVENKIHAAKEKEIHPLHEVEVDEDNNLPTDLPQFPPGAPQALPQEVEAGADETDGENMAHLQDKLSVIGKMVIDMTDPNRPRFTMNELRTVLMERNELKSKLIEVEEELALLKPKPPRKNTLEEEDDERYEGEELPVQGPINKEPDEKLYPGQRKPSGIRKFFNALFGSPRPSRSRQGSEVC